MRVESDIENPSTIGAKRPRSGPSDRSSSADSGGTRRRSIPTSRASARTATARIATPPRSEELTSELQSHSDLVCRLLLEKKKKKGAGYDEGPGRVNTLVPLDEDDLSCTSRKDRHHPKDY